MGVVAYAVTLPGRITVDAPGAVSIVMTLTAGALLFCATTVATALVRARRGRIPFASAVMITGRNRVVPAAIAASVDVDDASFRWSSAKVMSSTLFDVATPIAMMVPMSDGTLNVVWVTNSIHRMPAIAPGNAMMITRGSSQVWKLITNIR